MEGDRVKIEARTSKFPASGVVVERIIQRTDDRTSVITIDLPCSRELFTKIPWRKAEEIIMNDAARCAQQAAHDAFHRERGFECGGINKEATE